MNVILAADHNGVELKKVIVRKLEIMGHTVIDLGPFDSKESVDYVDYAKQLGHIITNGHGDMGVLICGTGQGMCIAANKVNGVRASLVHNIQCAPLAREHNNANVLCLGSWVTTEKQALIIVEQWFSEPYGKHRHVKRVEKIERNPNYKVIFANGVFDIVHSGHIELLNFAKSLGDKLVVAINSDDSTKILKGDSRPINNETDRKRVIESLRAVDESFIFDSISTKEILDRINPSVVVKGGEWTDTQVRERDNIPEHIEVVVYPLKQGYSSTAVINSIRDAA